MAIEMQCDGCGKRYRVGDQLAGKKVKCKACGHVMAVPGEGFLQDTGPVALRNSGDSTTAARSKPVRAGVAAAEEGSFEAIAAMAAMETGEGDDSSRRAARLAVRPAPAAAYRPSGRRAADSSKVAWGGISGGALLAIVRIVLRVTSDKSVNLAEILNTDTIGLLVLLIGMGLALVAVIGAGLGIIRESGASWSLLRIPVRRITIGAVLVIAGIVLVSQHASLVPQRKPTAWTNTHAAPIPTPADSSTSDTNSQPTAASDQASSAAQPAPQWDNVPKVSAADVQPKTAGAKARLTPDGKPVPPPPVDSGYAALTAAFPDDADAKLPRSRHSAAMLPSVIQTLDSPRLSDFEELRGPDRPGPWVFVRRRGAGGDLWQRFDASQQNADAWKPNGQVQLADSWAQMIFSQSGEYLIRQGGQGIATTIQVWSFSNGQLLQNIDGTGMADLVGFINDDQFLVSGSSGAVLAIASAKTGQKVRDLTAPVGFTFRGRECSISPDGALVAVPATPAATTDAGSSPALFLYNTTGGVSRRIVLPGFEKEKFRGSITPQASAFSRDGKRVAVLVNHHRSSLLFICGVAEGKVLASFEYPDLRTALHVSALSHARLVQWLGDTNCLLLNDSLIIDSATGRCVGCIDGEVAFFHDLGAAGRMLVRHRRAFGESERLDLCTLDADLLKTRLELTKAAGPIQFDPPEAPNARFGMVVQPKTSTASNLGVPPDPAPAADAKVTDAAIPIDASYSRIHDVLFSRPGEKSPAAVVALSLPDSGHRQWDPLRDPDFLLQRLDLATGKATGAPLHLPIFSKLLAVSPDATVAVVASDAGDRSIRQPMARLDLINVTTAKPVATFIPYADSPSGGPRPVPVVAPATAGQAGGEPIGPTSVVWAAMADNDALVTLSGSQVLTRWSVGGRRATWSRINISAPVSLSPGGKYVVARQDPYLLILDTKNGDPVGSLSPEPLVGVTDVKAAAFSPDGAAFYASTTNGLFRWDVKTGASGNPLTAEPIDQLEDLGGNHLLFADGRLFDRAAQSVIFKYIPFGGRHLFGGGGPAGRHWYLARTPAEGAPYLCSTVIPAPEHLTAAAEIAAHPALIHPGVQVSLQVNAGSAGGRIGELLAARLQANHLDQGPVVATLRVSAVESPTGEVVPFSRSMSIFRGGDDPNADKVVMQQSQCYYELVDANEHVLYGSPTTTILRNTGVAGVMLHKDQTVTQKLEELLENQVVDWARGIYVPAYLTADGKLAPRPEAVLEVPPRAKGAS